MYKFDATCMFRILQVVVPVAKRAAVLKIILPNNVVSQLHVDQCHAQLDGILP